MEIAHGHTGICRGIAKVVLVGILLIVLAKVILALLAVAFIGALIYLCARALYTRRIGIQHLLRSIEEGLFGFLAAVFQTTAAALAATAGWLSYGAARISLRSSRFTLTSALKFLGLLGWLVIAVLTTSIMLGSALLSWIATSGYTILCKLARQAREVLVLPLRFAVRTAVGAWITLRNQSSVICGFVVEIASGALVGAMLGLFFLPQVHPLPSRIVGAAVFGAFLGILVGFSRITRPGKAS